jgi:hypothetical protein
LLSKSHRSARVIYKQILNGIEPFLEDGLDEKRLAVAFEGLPVSGIRVDVWHHAAIENRLPVTRAIINAIQAHAEPRQLLLFAIGAS